MTVQVQMPQKKDKGKMISDIASIAGTVAGIPGIGSLVGNAAGSAYNKSTQGPGPVQAQQSNVQVPATSDEQVLRDTMMYLQKDPELNKQYGPTVQAAMLKQRRGM